MLRFAANLSTLFLENPFLERFQAAQECGFKGVEFRLAYEYPVKEIAYCLKQTNVELVSFNAPVGNRLGDAGLAALPDRKREFMDSVELALAYARELCCPRIHVQSGFVPSDDQYPLYFETCIENLRYAANKFAPFGITLLIEPVNRHTAPGYFIENIKQAKELIQAIKLKNLALQFDFFHVQMTEGNLANRFLENLSLIEHIQIAGVPERHEPDIGEIYYPYLFDIIEKSGYSGWIGCEYNPQKSTRECLGWIKKYL